MIKDLYGLIGQFTPSVNLDFMKAAMPSGLTFTRSSIATRVNASGNIETVAANIPRFDYDPASLSLKGLLIEESRTNNVLYSQDASQSAWSKQGCSVTVNNAGAPDNTATFNVFTEDATNASHRVIIATPINVATGATYTASCYLKAGTRRYVTLAITGSSGSHSFGIIDTQSWTITAAASGSNGVVPTVSLQPFRGGIYRAIVTGSVLTNTVYSLAIAAINTNIGLANSAQGYTGDGVSTVAFWGAQLEPGTFATSYIPTTTAAVTRDLDLCSISTSFLNIYQGSFFVDYRLSALPLSRAHILSLNDGGSNRLSIRAYDAATGSSFVLGDGTNVKTMSYAVVANQSYRAAMAYNATNAGIAVNGALTNTSTTGYLFAAGTIPSTVFIGSTGATTAITGWISRIRYYPNRLPNPYLQALTT